MQIDLDFVRILIFIYIEKCRPCLFGSGEITPPFLILTSFGLQSSDVGPFLLGVVDASMAHPRKYLYAKPRPS